MYNNEMTPAEKRRMLEMLDDDVARGQELVDLREVPVGIYEATIVGFRFADDLSAYYIAWEVAEMAGSAIPVVFESRQGLTTEVGKKFAGRELRKLGYTSRLSILFERAEELLFGIVAKLEISAREAPDGKVWHDCRVLSYVRRDELVEEDEPIHVASRVVTPAKQAAPQPEVKAPAPAPKKAGKKKAESHPAVEDRPVYVQSGGAEDSADDISDAEIPF